MSKQYKLNSGVLMEFQNDELIITNVETGFAAKGNKHAYEILQLMNEPVTMDSVVETLCKKYKDTQHPRIKKSVPNVTQWAIERGIVEEIDSTE